jgi:hypothetical protein
MTKLTVLQVWEKLIQTESEIHEIMVWTADHGVKPDKFDSKKVETITKDMREDLLLIRGRCVGGFEGRKEKLSKITDEGKAVEKRR